MAILNSYVSHYQRVSIPGGLGFGMIFTDKTPGQFFRKNAMVRAQKRGKHWTLVARLSTLGNPYCVGIFQWLD